LLRSRYRLLERIGQGGMSTVYRAFDAQTGATVAVKEVRADVPVLRAAVEGESALLSQLSHPALPAAIDSFGDQDAHYLVMTFVPGADLAQQLARRALPFEPCQVLQWADDLLDVLDYLHTRQPRVIHRDIKPRNLKLDDKGHVVLLDFGLARGVVGAEQATIAGYTLDYAPLEQLTGGPAEARGDLYALGATLYELIGRRMAPNAASRAAAVASGAADPLTPLTQLGQPVWAVLERALALQPAQRPPTARAMRFALQEALAGTPTTLAPVHDPKASVARPSGTVTFMATEIVGSQPSAAVLARHDVLLHAALSEVDAFVFATSERGVTAAFATPAQALEAALAAQRSLGSAGLRPRMALHTDTAEIAGADYVSPGLPRLARVLASAHPGQIVLTSTTAALTSAVALRDLGEHRLADLARPERIYQVVAVDLPAEFPPLQGQEVRAAHLPPLTTTLVGRGRELTETVALVRRPSGRLLTLAGPGGVGKTRLAVQAAEALLDDFPDGVYFVALSPVRNPDLVLAAVAHTIGVREQPEQSLFESVAAELQRRHMLLVLDNFEHLLAATPVVERLLAQAPLLKVLVTSRIRLGLDGEQVYALGPLALQAGIELFVQRARLVRADLVLVDTTAASIAAICTRLDCLPLAIELAASRANLFGPADLLARLERGLALVAAGAADRPPRQLSLRATLAWSYELLPPSAQRLFAGLGCFVGGADLEAIEAVCAEPSDVGLTLVTDLSDLAAASLLTQAADGARYEMLETVREYAAERLATGAGTRGRHAAHFLDLAETADARLGGPLVDAWLKRLALEHPNLRAALAWLAEQPSKDGGLRLAAALWRFWQVHGHLSEGRTWLEALLDATSEQSGSARARALVGAGALAWRQRDVARAQTCLSQAVEACREVGESAGLGTALKHLGLLALYAEPPRFADAAALFSEALAVRRSVHDGDGVASCLNDLAVVALRQSEFTQARAWLEQSLDECRRLNNRYTLSFVLDNLSLVALVQGEYDRATALLSESLALARELGSQESIGCALCGLASLAAVRGDAAQAARLFGASEALRATIGVSLSPLERATFDRHLSLARKQMSPDAWDGLVADGRGLSLEALAV
jgi:predicted ATPase